MYRFHMLDDLLRFVFDMYENLINKVHMNVKMSLIIDDSIFIKIFLHFVVRQSIR